MNIKLPKLIATSVVRGSKQGESHGGIFAVDFEKQEGEQHVDWNTMDIKWEGHGGDRGLRGICFDGDEIYIAGSNELFVYDRDFNLLRSHRNRYLRHCHEICRFERKIFLTSTAYDSLLVFNLDTNEFDFGFHLQRPYGEWSGHTFDPRGSNGPRRVNDFQLNMVHLDSHGIFFCGMNMNALLYMTDKLKITEVCSLPKGTNNARPWNDGVIFIDSDNDCVRFVGRDGRQQVFRIPTVDASLLESDGVNDASIARQAFGRGLCPVGDRFLAAGSSPSTITLYDLEADMPVGSVNLSMNIRNMIHGLEVWPYDD